MTPEELAKRHPKLYPITEPGAWSSIKRHGLLSTSRLLDLFEIETSQRIVLETTRRAISVPLHNPRYESIILNDQQPLREESLKNCLDDNLKPEEWLKLLNGRVFFWPSEENLHRHLNARLNRTRSREIIIIDTLSLAKVHAENIELCPINSGVTFRKTARRGKNTFTPLLKYSYAEWSKMRGQRDKIQEVTISNQVLEPVQNLFNDV
jgi:hypothetical protein